MKKLYLFLCIVLLLPVLCLAQQGVSTRVLKAGGPSVENMEELPPFNIICPPQQVLPLGANCNAILGDYRSLAIISGNESCTAQSGFAGDYAVANWEQSGYNGNYINTSGAPGSVTLNIFNNTQQQAASFFLTHATCTGPVSFNWSYQANNPNKDFFYFFRNGNYTKLSVNSDPATQGGTYTANVNTGDYVGFVIIADEAGANPFTATVSAFTAPVPNLVTIIQSPLQGSVLWGTTTWTVSLTATDLNGNTANCSFAVFLVDNTPPVIVCPPAQTLPLGANCSAALPDYRSLAQVSDNCSGPQAGCSSQTGFAGPYAPATWEETVYGGGSVNTSAAPGSITLKTMDIGAEQAGSFFLKYLPCNGQVTFNWNYQASNPDGNWFFYFINGNYEQLSVNNGPGSQSGTVTIPVHTGDYFGFVITSQQGASSPCSVTVSSFSVTIPNSIIVTQLPAPGTAVSGPGTTVVTLTATDLSGNASNCTFDVNRINGTPPTIVCPQTQAFALDGNCSAVLGDYRSLATISGGCSGSQGVCITQTGFIGSYAPANWDKFVHGGGSINTTGAPGTVTLSTTDIGLEQAASSFLIHLPCTGPVTFTWSYQSDNPAANTFYYFRNGNYEQLSAHSGPASQNGTFTINLNEGNYFGFVIISNQGSVSPCTVTISSFSAPVPNGITITQSPAAGTVVSGSGTMPVTLTVTDSYGNISNCTFNVNKVDATPPTFTRPADITIPFTSTCGYNASVGNTGDVTDEADNCSAGLQATYSDMVSTCGNNTVISRTWNLSDNAGNQAPTQVQTITVTDNNTDYIIYATKEVSFGKDNYINGDVGVTALTGTADFDKGDVLDPYKVLAKKIKTKSPSQVNNLFYVPATGGPAPPFMTYNGTGGSGSYTANTNGTINGNYAKLKIASGVTATVTGNDFGKIEIGENANVSFSSAMINMEELLVNKGKNGGTSNVYFNGCTGVKIKDKVTVEENSRINVGGPKVIFYLGDNNNDEEKFVVKGDNTQITANIMIPNGKLTVSGKNKNSVTIMTGWFVVEKLQSDGEKITWNRNVCTGSPSFAPVSTEAYVVTQPSPAAKNETQIPEPDRFVVQLYPNPTAGDFYIRVLGGSNEPLQVRIINGTGAVVQAAVNVSKAGLQIMGNKLSAGIYFVEVTQGKNKQVVKLVRTN